MRLESEYTMTWNLNEIEAVHSLVDWQLRSEQIDENEYGPILKGKYGEWHPFPEGQRFWMGPWVPDDQIWVLTAFCAQNHSGPTWELVVMMHSGEEWMNLHNDVAVPRYKWVEIDHQIILRPGYRLGAWWRGATAKDDLRVNALWYVPTKKRGYVEE